MMAGSVADFEVHGVTQKTGGATHIVVNDCTADLCVAGRVTVVADSVVAGLERPESSNLPWILGSVLVGMMVMSLGLDRCAPGRMVH